MYQSVYKITQTHKLINSIAINSGRSYHNNPLNFLKPLEKPIIYWFIYDIQNGIGNLYDSNKKFIEYFNIIKDSLHESGHVWASDSIIPIPDHSIYRFYNFNPYKKTFKICKNNKFICEMNGSGMYMVNVMYGNCIKIEDSDYPFDFHIKYPIKKNHNQMNKLKYNTGKLFGF
jgi:hypothetical protein